jgi:hypothetical protein
MLTFPLSAHLALVSLEGLTQGNHVATDLIVGDINTRTKLASTGLLYSPSREFLLRRGDRAESSLSYFEYVSQARRAGILQP